MSKQAKNLPRKVTALAPFWALRRGALLGGWLPPGDYTVFKSENGTVNLDGERIKGYMRIDSIVDTHGDTFQVVSGDLITACDVRQVQERLTREQREWEQEDRALVDIREIFNALGVRKGLEQLHEKQLRALAGAVHKEQARRTEQSGDTDDADEDTAYDDPEPPYVPKTKASPNTYNRNLNRAWAERPLSKGVKR